MSSSASHDIAARVLAVDDCPAMLELMRASLERLGYSVLAVDSGRAALDAVVDTSFDVIVLDVEMPDLDGMAVGRALRSSSRAATAAIAMHSSMAEAVVRNGFDQYDAYVAKSGNLGLLGEQVDRLVRSRRAARPAECVAGQREA